MATPFASPQLASALPVLESLNDAVVAADLSGHIVYLNAATEKLLGWPRQELLARPLQVLMPARMRDAHQAGFSRFIATRAPHIMGTPVRVPALHRAGHELDVELTLSLLQPAGTTPLMMASLRDLRTRVELERQIDAQRRLRAQFAVMSALAQADTLEAAAPRILQGICESLHWDLGMYWLHNEDSETLSLFASWGPGEQPYAQFLRLSGNYTFKYGEGAPGRTWADCKPRWHGNLECDPIYKRGEVARQLGLRESILFPILHRQKVLGVIEFVNRTASKREDELMRTLATACFQIGQFQERQRAETQLRDSRDWLSTTLSSIGDAVVATDTQSRLIFINSAAESLLGCSRSAGMGLALQALLAPIGEAGAQVGAFVQRVLAQPHAPPAPQVVRLHALQLEISGACIGSGSPGRGAVLVLRDVAAQRWQQESARLLAQASTALTASLRPHTGLQQVAQLVAPDFADWCIIYLVDAPGAPLLPVASAYAGQGRCALSEALARALVEDPNVAYGPAATVQSGRPELLPHIDDDALRAWGLYAGACAQPASLLSVALSARGRVLGALCLARRSAAHALGASELELAGKLGEHIGYAVDNARLYRESQEAISVRDNFLSIASHELKTPLTPLQLQVQSILRHQHLSPHRLQHKLQVIGSQVDRLGTLITRMLDLARITGNRMDLQLEPMDLSALVRSMANDFAPEMARHGSTLQVCVPEHLRGVWDGGRLGQVLANLLSNALKFGAGKPVVVRLQQAHGQVTLSVQDFGVGIAKADQARIFGQFERAVSTRQYGGFGLGLWICRQLIEALGGTIAVCSAPGEGSTFVVTLPLQAPQPSGTAPARALHAPS